MFLCLFLARSPSLLSFLLLLFHMRIESNLLAFLGFRVLQLEPGVEGQALLIEIKGRVIVSLMIGLISQGLDLIPKEEKVRKFLLAVFVIPSFFMEEGMQED